jgi:hypothetical protein
VDKGTHGHNILDLVLVDTFSLISKLSVEPPVGTSDHTILAFTVNVTPPVPEGSNSTQSAYWNCAKADYVSLNSYLLPVDWNGTFQPSFDVDSCWSAFLSIIYEAVQLFVPLIHV